ncbi:unnamed protein product, partial [marine sediment metagenome]
PCAVPSPSRAAGLAADENTSGGIIHNMMNIVTSIIIKLNIE